MRVRGILVSRFVWTRSQLQALHGSRTEGAFRTAGCKANDAGQADDAGHPALPQVFPITSASCCLLC